MDVTFHLSYDELHSVTLLLAYIVAVLCCLMLCLLFSSLPSRRRSSGSQALSFFAVIKWSRLALHSPLFVRSYEFLVRQNTCSRSMRGVVPLLSPACLLGLHDLVKQRAPSRGRSRQGMDHSIRYDAPAVTGWGAMREADS